MSKNDGNVHYTNYYEKPREEQEKIAAEFSEGSEDLKDFMLYLWGKGFNTVASCAGHEERKEKDKVLDIMPNYISYAGYPYIEIDVSMIDKIFKDRGISAKRLLLNLYKNKEIPNLEIGKTKLEDEKGQTKEIVKLHIDLDGDASLFKNLKKNFEDLESADKYKQDLTEDEKFFLNTGIRLMTGNIHDGALNSYDFRWTTNRIGKRFMARKMDDCVVFYDRKEEELTL